MITLALIGALTAPADIDGITAFEGLPIVEVDVVAPDEEDTTVLRALIEMQPGYILSSDLVRAALKRLYALGRFSAIRVEADRVHDAASIRFILVPLRRIAEMRVDGLRNLSEGPLLQAIGVRSGDELERRIPDIVRERTQTYLARHGFPQAIVVVEASVDGVLTLTITEGPPLIVREVLFSGEPRVAASVLLAGIDTRPGERLEEPMLEQDRARIEQAFLDRGFRNVRVDKPSWHVLDNQASVRFSVEAGDRIALVLAGNRVLNDGTLLTHWPTTSPAVDTASLQLFAAGITSRYQREGYADVRVSVRGFRDKATGITRYLVSIREGEPIFVEQLTFTGATAIAPDVLREQVLVYLSDQLARQDMLQPLAASDRYRSHRAYGPVPRDVPVAFVPPARRYVADLYREALDNVAAAYRDRGFIEVDIKEPVVERRGTRAHLHVAIVEGPQFRIASIRLRGNDGLGSAELLDAMAAPEPGVTAVTLGGAYSAAAAEDARIAMVKRYRERGFLYARVATETIIDATSHNVDLICRINEGPEVRLRSILVHGARHTREGVVRSRISLQPGDRYNLRQALDDQRAIAELGVFSSVRVKLIDEDRPAEQKDLVAEVTERPRQIVEVVPGISTADGPRLQLSYAHINVFGTAANVHSSLKVNRQVFFPLYGIYEETMRLRYDGYRGSEQLTKALERDARLGVRSPRFRLLPIDTLFRVDLIHERDNAVPFSLDANTAIAGLEIFPWSSLTIAIEPQASLTQLECPVLLTDEQQVILDLDAADPCVEGLVALRQTARRIDRGRRRTVKVGPTVTLDRRDNALNPSRGFLLYTRAAYAVGESQAEPGDPFEPFTFAKMQGGMTGYLPLAGAVWVLGAQAGSLRLLRGAIPIEERFYLGGRDTLRGFVESSLIPDDACVVSADEDVPPGCAEPILRTGEAPVTRGGNTFGLLTGEVRIPMTENVGLDVFVDTGNLWVDGNNASWRLRYTLGAGLRYNTPIGALAIDLGINLAPRSRNGEVTAYPHLKIGGR